MCKMNLNPFVQSPQWPFCQQNECLTVLLEPNYKRKQQNRYSSTITKWNTKLFKYGASKCHHYHTFHPVNKLPLPCVIYNKIDPLDNSFNLGAWSKKEHFTNKKEITFRHRNKRAKNNPNAFQYKQEHNPLVFRKCLKALIQFCIDYKLISSIEGNITLPTASQLPCFHFPLLHSCPRTVHSHTLSNPLCDQPELAQ